MVRASVEFTFDQAVKTLGVTPERLELLIAKGEVKAYSVAGQTVIPREAILEYFGGVSALLPRDKKKLAAQKAE
jgi:hypothetical protein